MAWENEIELRIYNQKWNFWGILLLLGKIVTRFTVRLICHSNDRLSKSYFELRKEQNILQIYPVKKLIGIKANSRTCCRTTFEVWLYDNIYNSFRKNLNIHILKKYYQRSSRNITKLMTIFTNIRKYRIGFTFRCGLHIGNITYNNILIVSLFKYSCFHWVFDDDADQWNQRIEMKTRSFTWLEISL